MPAAKHVDMHLMKVGTSDQLADVLTKALPRDLHEQDVEHGPDLPTSKQPFTSGGGGHGRHAIQGLLQA